MAFSVLEKTTQLFTGNFVDETGVAIPAASLSTLTLTLYDVVSGTKINSRNVQNVLNANNVTVSSSGGLTWTMQPADNPIISTALPNELHVALWEWTYGAGGTKAGKHETGFSIKNLTNVT